MTTIYDVLRRPIVTEKTNYMVTQLHQYVFEVASDANRTLVKDAVEKLFNVTVLRVNIINMPGKRSLRRNRRLLISNPAYKKAVVTILPEDRIPIFEGVE